MKVKFYHLGLVGTVFCLGSHAYASEENLGLTLSSMDIPADVMSKIEAGKAKIKKTKEQIELLKLLKSKTPDPKEVLGKIQDAANKKVEMSEDILQAAIAMGEPEVVQKVLSVGGKVPGVTKQLGGTVLLMAVAELSRNKKTRKMMDVIGVLLQNGANVNAIQQSTKETALMAAARLGDLNLVKRFLEEKADKTVKNAKGQMAADIARDRMETLKGTGDAAKAQYEQAKLIWELLK